MLQIGSRIMLQYQLLKEVGRLKKPVFTKEGLSATIERMVKCCRIYNE